MKKPFVLISIFLFFCICISIIAIQFILHGCLWWKCSPQRSFRIVDLELPTNLFPDGAIVNHIYPLSDGFGTIDNGSQSVYWDNGNSNAGYTIYRYPTIRKAMAQVDFNKHLLVNSETRDIWHPPTDLMFSSTTADVVYIACGYWSNKNCAMVARYQEYVVFFTTTIDTNMTFARFEKVLFYIDEQISSRLYP